MDNTHPYSTADSKNELPLPAAVHLVPPSAPCRKKRLARRLRHLTERRQVTNPRQFPMQRLPKNPWYPIRNLESRNHFRPVRRSLRLWASPFQFRHLLVFLSDSSPVIAFGFLQFSYFSSFSFRNRSPELLISEISALSDTFFFNPPPLPTPSTEISSSPPVRSSPPSSILPCGSLVSLFLSLMDVRRYSPHSITYPHSRLSDIAADSPLV
jgi:hypothetical protein